MDLFKKESLEQSDIKHLNKDKKVDIPKKSICTVLESSYLSCFIAENITLNMKRKYLSSL
jgi:hypothetical protein